MWRKENPLTLLVKMWVVAATVEDSIEVLQKKYINKNRASLVAQCGESSSHCRGRGFDPRYRKIPGAAEQPGCVPQPAWALEPGKHNSWSPCTLELCSKNATAMRWLCTTTGGEGNGNPLQYSCPENPMDRGAWQAAVQGVAKSRRCLKQLSTHHN